MAFLTDEFGRPFERKYSLPIPNAFEGDDAIDQRLRAEITFNAKDKAIRNATALLISAKPAGYTTKESPCPDMSPYQFKVSERKKSVPHTYTLPTPTNDIEKNSHFLIHYRIFRFEDIWQSADLRIFRINARYPIGITRVIYSRLGAGTESDPYRAMETTTSLDVNTAFGANFVEALFMSCVPRYKKSTAIGYREMNDKALRDQLNDTFGVSRLEILHNR